jgi:O-antigen/teichoic acid export membrane protein
MVDAAAVGQYAAAARLSEATYFIAGVITGSVFPALAEAHKVDRTLYERRLVQLFSLMIAIGIGLAIPTMFVAHWAVDLLYGQAYQEAAEVLIIHIWSATFIFLGLASARWYWLDHIQHLCLIRTGSGAVMNVILNFYLIESHGIIGAAYATLLSYAFANFISYLLYPRLWPLFWLTVRSFNLFNLARGGLKR